MSVRVVEASPVRSGTPIVAERAHPHLPGATTPEAKPDQSLFSVEKIILDEHAKTKFGWPEVDEPTVVSIEAAPDTEKTD